MSLVLSVKYVRHCRKAILRLIVEYPSLIGVVKRRRPLLSYTIGHSADATPYKKAETPLTGFPETQFTALTAMANTFSQRKGRGDYNAEDYIKNASFVFSDEYTAPILSWLDPRPGDRIIDLGCGTGQLTAKIQDAIGAEGLVLGVDYSEDMISEASRNGVKSTLVFDVQDLELSPLSTSGKLFDAAFSNAALHWCKRNPSGVLAGLRRILKPGGRFVCEMGGYMNCVGVRMALHVAVRKRGLNSEDMDPWYFPSIEEYRALLQNAGFRVDTMSLLPRLTPLGNGGLRAWLKLFVRETFLKTVKDADAEAIIDEVEEICAVDCKDREGNWSLMYVRLRFAATLAG